MHIRSIEGLLEEGMDFHLFSIHKPIYLLEKYMASYIDILPARQLTDKTIYSMFLKTRHKSNVSKQEKGMMQTPRQDQLPQVQSEKQQVMNYQQCPLWQQHLHQ